uniref:EGR1 n=1 Tax=Steinernema glaseri TaxID=37863 RepID=A0A1I7ZZT4_9BILA
KGDAMNNDAIRFLSASGPLIGPGFAPVTTVPSGMPDAHVLQALAAGHAPFAPLPSQLYPGFGRVSGTCAPNNEVFNNLCLNYLSTYYLTPALSSWPSWRCCL